VSPLQLPQYKRGSACWREAGRGSPKRPTGWSRRPEAGRAGSDSSGENKAKGESVEALRNLKWRRWRQILRDAQQKAGRKMVRVEGKFQINI